MPFLNYLKQGSANLVNLGVNGLDSPTKRLSEILKTMIVLEVLSLYNCTEVDAMGTAIVEALHDSNGTLCDIELPW